MERPKAHQLQMIWEHIPSPIAIPAETRKRLADLLGDLLSAYWQGCQENCNSLPRGEEHDSQDRR
jgi:hypothetical protein